MLNPKTGTVWTPDIRPDKIETFEETYTSEGGEQQAVTYKIVDNHPILNKVLDKFAFFKTHVSAIWYNKLANITLKQKLDEMDAGIQDVSVKTNVTQAELFSFADGITTNVFRAYRVGHTITFHMECVTTSNISYGSVIGTFKSPYQPGINYIVVPVRNNSSSFSEIATLWIRNNGNCELYGNAVTSGTRFYIQGSFTY